MYASEELQTLANDVFAERVRNKSTEKKIWDPTGI